jgi:hypothetical protein
VAIEKLLDNRNIELWNHLNSIHDITVEFGDFYEYGVYSINDSSVIFVPQDKIDIPGFTHELLHIFLRTKDVYIGSDLSLRVNEKPHLQNVLSKRLIDHIGNCLCHIKMLPIFTEMGFCERDFITDYGVNKLNEDDVRLLQKNFRKKPLFGNSYFNKLYIDGYVGKYFAAKSCPNKAFDYSGGLGSLKSINAELYTILDDFMNEWLNLEISDISPITGGYIIMAYNFINRIENWILNNKIK